MLPQVKEVIDKADRHCWFLRANQAAKWGRVSKWWVDVALRNRMVTQLENKDGLASESHS